MKAQTSYRNLKARTVLLLLLPMFTVYRCNREAEAITIHTIGDSTMANKKPEVYPETGWCQVLDRYFDESVTVENHAVNGRSTKSFIDEGRWELVLDQLKEGDYVFIQFGHNDQKKYDTTRYTTPYGSYTRNLQMFVEDIKARNAIPFLFTPIVRRKLDSVSMIIDTHGAYPDAVRNLAAELQVPLIDLEKQTKEWIQSLGDSISKIMFVWTAPSDRYPEGRKDDTHLSEEGAKRVAELAAEAIKNTDKRLATRIK